MPKIPPINGREVLRVLLKSGFYIHHQSGSHARLFHSQRPELRVTIPVHNKTLPQKTLKSILKQADIKDTEFLRLLKS
jgi:predicted RNA binding protein YcfA (HicA-like mRNA interferase family)